MNMKKVFFGFLGVIVVSILLFTLFGWGAPMTESNKGDVKAITELLEKTDTTGAKVTDITFSPLEGMTDETGKKIDIQTVEYNMVLDTLTTNHFAIIKVHKGFLKYKLDGIYKVVK